MNLGENKASTKCRSRLQSVDGRKKEFTQRNQNTQERMLKSPDRYRKRWSMGNPLQSSNRQTNFGRYRQYIISCERTSYSRDKTSDVKFFDEDELQQTIGKINTGKSTGLDGVLNEVLKLIAKGKSGL